MHATRVTRAHASATWQVPLEGADAEYVDELGCAADLGGALQHALGGMGGALVRLHLDLDTLQTLRHMLHADVLIASDSSFSLAAGVLSHGLVLSMESWKRFPDEARRGIRFPLALTADGEFECSSLLHLWRERAGLPIAKTLSEN